MTATNFGLGRGFLAASGASLSLEGDAVGRGPEGASKVSNVTAAQEHITFLFGKTCKSA